MYMRIDNDSLKKIVYMTSHFFQDAKLRVISYVSSQWWITTDPNCKFPSSCQVQLSVKKIDISLLLLTLPQQWLQCIQHVLFAFQAFRVIIAKWLNWSNFSHNRDRNSIQTKLAPFWDTLKLTKNI